MELYKPAQNPNTFFCGLSDTWNHADISTHGHVPNRHVPESTWGSLPLLVTWCGNPGARLYCRRRLQVGMTFPSRQNYVFWTSEPPTSLLTARRASYMGFFNSGGYRFSIEGISGIRGVDGYVEKRAPATLTKYGGGRTSRHVHFEAFTQSLLHLCLW